MKHNRLIVVMLFAVCLIGSAPVMAIAPEFEITNGAMKIEHVSLSNPIIYDNDWWLDVFDSFYIWALASLDEADLRGNIVSRDMWDHPDYLYPMQRCIDEANEAVAKARAVGFKHIPDPVAGSAEVLQPPASGEIDDTVAKSNPGAELIIAEAAKASADKPLLVVTGGPLTTVATALLLEPSIAERIIVFGLSTHNFAYNGKDGWSAYIVAKRARYVEWAAGSFWDRNGVFEPAHFDSLPDNPLTAWMKRFIRTDLGAANQMGDGAPLAWLNNPSCWTGAETREASFNGKAVIYQKSETADILNIPKANTDMKKTRKEFFRVFQTPDLFSAE